MARIDIHINTKSIAELNSRRQTFLPTKEHQTLDKTDT
jgi:hypothetical protein